MHLNHKPNWLKEWGIMACVGLLALCSVAATVVIKISDFPNTATLNNTDQFLIGDPGVTNKNISWAQLRALIGTNGTQVFNINTNYTTNSFVTYQIVTNQYVVTNTVVNQYVTTNVVNNQFVTNSYVTQQYVTNQYVTTNFVNTQYVTNVAYITEIKGGKAYITNIYLEDGTFTNNIFVVTNTWANAPTGTVAMHVFDQYVRTFTPISITGLTSRSNTVSEPVVMTITNASSSNITVTLDSGIKLVDRTSSFTVSNGSFGVLSMRYHPVGLTNAIWKQW